MSSRRYAACRIVVWELCVKFTVFVFPGDVGWPLLDNAVSYRVFPRCMVDDIINQRDYFVGAWSSTQMRYDFIVYFFFTHAPESVCAGQFVTDSDAQSQHYARLDDWSTTNGMQGSSATPSGDWKTHPKIKLNHWRCYIYYPSRFRNTTCRHWSKGETESLISQ